MKKDTTTNANNSIDAYSPLQVAQRVETVGIKKAQMPTLQLLVLGVMAGAFIAFGGMFYTLVITGGGMPLGVTRLLGGIAFSLGLILVVVGGAELFTGNNLIAMAWAHRKVSSAALLRNWTLVYVGNLVGSLGTAVLVYLSGTLAMGDSAVAETAIGIAIGKTSLPFMQAFVRGILCNVLVCLAVWMCFSARSVTAKVLAIIFPISAFVALGFEHCVANMYLIPIGMLEVWFGDTAIPTGLDASTLTIAGMLGNLVPVTLGNIVGGTLLVALVYYLIYIRGEGEGM